MEWWKIALLRTFITATLVSNVVNQPGGGAQPSQPQSPPQTTNTSQAPSAHYDASQAPPQAYNPHASQQPPPYNPQQPPPYNPHQPPPYNPHQGPPPNQYPPPQNQYPPPPNQYPPPHPQMGPGPGYYAPTVDPAKAYADAVSAKAAALPVPPEFEVSIKVTNLQKRRMSSKPDVICVTYVRKMRIGTEALGPWNEYDRSEIILKHLNPEFMKKFVFPNSYDENVLLKFVIYEVGSKGQLVENPLGYNEQQFSVLIKNQITVLPLLRKRSSNNQEVNTDAKITIRVETLAKDPEKVSFKLSGVRLAKKDVVGHSDPYIEIFKTSPKLGDVLVYRSEVVGNETSPVWKQITLTVRSICNGNEKRPLKFICSDYDSDGDRKFIGIFQTTMADFRRLKPYDLTDPGNKNKPTGQINISNWSSVQEPTFAAYLRGGLQIRSIIAIDFTNSNLSVQTPGSLHFLDPSGTLNYYEQTMYSVIPVIEGYTWNHVFTVLGFGTQVADKGARKVFNLNPASADCMGVRGVQEAYRASLGTLKLGSEVNMASLIQEAVRIIKTNKNDDQYYILLILTDGDVSANNAVQINSALKEASAYPISIIVASLGQATFDNLKKLDADQLMADSSALGRRDIVQFVPLNKFLSHNFNPLVFEREMLAEVPDQVVAYMQSRNINPKAAVASSGQQLPNLPPLPPLPAVPQYMYAPQGAPMQAPPPHNAYQPAPPYGAPYGHNSSYNASYNPAAGPPPPGSYNQAAGPYTQPPYTSSQMNDASQYAGQPPNTVPNPSANASTQLQSNQSFSHQSGQQGDAYRSYSMAGQTPPPPNADPRASPQAGYSQQYSTPSFNASHGYASPLQPTQSFSQPGPPQANMQPPYQTTPTSPDPHNDASRYGSQNGSSNFSSLSTDGQSTHTQTSATSPPSSYTDPSQTKTKPSQTP